PVYLCEDLKHDRQVALKLLKPELAAVLGAERFVQEIKTTAALQHPHILPLFDSGAADGFLFYVMPFIDGETLRAKLDRETQLGVDEAVRIAREVLDALHYSHERGIVHRDVKPENILLHGGHAMVADFGIALAVSAAAGGRMTETGLSLGTPHYMSPEQATAEKDISARSDVYSLGSVLYEMLTGNPPHVGASAQQIIMKIITTPAELVTVHRKSVPANVAAAVAKSLEKLPADRFANAAEFGAALGNSSFANAKFTSGAAVGGHRGVSRGAFAATASLAVLAIAGLTWALARPRVESGMAGPVRFQLEPPPEGFVLGRGYTPAISPDGRRIAFIGREKGKRLIHVRELGQTKARALAGTETVEAMTFSPDGDWIAFQSGLGGELNKVAVDGSTLVPISTSRGNSQLGTPSGVTWVGGTIVAGFGGRLYRVPASGGALEQLFGSDSIVANADNVGLPVAMVDGKTILFTNSRANVIAGSLVDGSARRVALQAARVLGAVDGVLVYSTELGAVMAVRFDAANFKVLGSPEPIESGLQIGVRSDARAVLSPSGVFAMFAGDRGSQLLLRDVRGAAKPLLADEQQYMFPRFSPDGRKVAYAVVARGGADVYVYDIATATPTRLSTDVGINDRPEWTPDGKQVLYRHTQGATRLEGIWWQPIDKSAPASSLTGQIVGPLKNVSMSEGLMSPDGQAMLIRSSGAPTGRDIWYVNTATATEPHPFEVTQFDELMPRFSPDGRWVAYVSTESGDASVYVRPFPGPGGRVQVSAGPGSEPVWSPDGRRIYYISGRELIAANVITGATFTVGTRETLFTDDFIPGAIHANYDVARDGKSFLMPMAKDQASQFSVVVNWLQDVKRRLAAREQGRAK
ncbi:MAG: protein kinase, partial [Gemmatimonas sp.]